MITGSGLALENNGIAQTGVFAAYTRPARAPRVYVYAVYKIILMSNAKMICMRMRGRSAAGHARDEGASSSSMIMSQLGEVQRRCAAPILPAAMATKPLERS